MTTMNKYAQWMQESAASIHTGGYRSRKGTASKYAIVYDNKTKLIWTEGRGTDLDEAVKQAISKTKTAPRPLHENEAGAVALAAQLAEAKARIAELEKKPVKAPAKSDEDEIEGPSGLSVAQAASARLKK